VRFQGAIRAERFCTQDRAADLDLQEEAGSLAQGAVAGPGSSDTFETPEHFSVADRTSSALALIWEANTAAAGFNVYRSATSGGHYTKIISAPVTGASFADGGLGPNTTYYYQIAAVDSAGQESPRTSPIAGTTGSLSPLHATRISARISSTWRRFALARTSSGAKLKRWAAMTTWVTAWIPTVISSAKGLFSIDCVTVLDGGKACMTIRGTGADVVKMPRRHVGIDGRGRAAPPARSAKEHAFSVREGGC
jgi:hypothetical protein